MVRVKRHTRKKGKKVISVKKHKRKRKGFVKIKRGRHTTYVDAKTDEGEDIGTKFINTRDFDNLHSLEPLFRKR